MNTQNYCCEELKEFIEDPRIKIGYNPEHRMYYLDITSTGTHYVIRYCPACGTFLPKNLVDTWFEILDQEYNINDPYNTQSHLVPEEFKDETWWKQRHL